MKEARASLLIVEDDLDVAEMLYAYFRIQGFQVTVANWGEDGVSTCLSILPDLVILDVRLPDIDGFEVASRLRANRKTRDTPIIFLTERREQADRLRGLSLKAEDYITKPFDVQELRLRVNNILERNRRIAMSNRITGLPEGDLVDERLNDYLVEPDSSILVISLKHLGRFREVYGPVASDDLLRAITLMLQDLLRSHGAPDDFLGQLDQTSFLLITRADLCADMKEQVRKRLGQSLDYFYRDQDRDTEVFLGHRLAVDIHEFAPEPGTHLTLPQLKKELERLYR